MVEARGVASDCHSVAAGSDEPNRGFSRKEPKVDIYVDGDACPVREEIFRMAARLRLDVLVVSNGSRPIRPPTTPNVRMVLVGDSADASDDWIEEHISAADTIAASHSASWP